MMTIDEVIECEKSHRINTEYHEQLAEWLEELKDYRMRLVCNDMQTYYDAGYNKAIDEAIEIVKGNYRMEALEKLEQLKEGESE